MPNDVTDKTNDTLNSCRSSHTLSKPDIQDGHNDPTLFRILNYFDGSQYNLILMCFDKRDCDFFALIED